MIELKPHISLQDSMMDAGDAQSSPAFIGLDSRDSCFPRGLRQKAGSPAEQPHLGLRSSHYQCQSRDAAHPYLPRPFPCAVLSIDA
jgi:hypothetical protein